jgi:hydroxyethylthiazole kinase
VRQILRHPQHEQGPLWRADRYFVRTTENSNKGEIMQQYLENVRTNAPLVHNITNYVTVNDVANILIAAGASPIMSDDLADAPAITSICNALVINIGTLNQRTIPAMFAAGKKSNQLGHTTALDPVGAGASDLRTQTALQLLQEVRFDLIRGNISEIKTLAQGTGTTKGVDADVADAITEQSLPATIDLARAFAQQTGAVVAISGAIDVVTDGQQTTVIRNGHPLMSQITGSGCMLSALTTAYISATPAAAQPAASAAFIAMGLSGEIAAQRLSEQDGNSTFRNYLIDAVFNLSAERLAKGARFENQ